MCATSTPMDEKTTYQDLGFAAVSPPSVPIAFSFLQFNPIYASSFEAEFTLQDSVFNRTGELTGIRR